MTSLKHFIGALLGGTAGALYDDSDYSSMLIGAGAGAGLQHGSKQLSKWVEGLKKPVYSPGLSSEVSSTFNKALSDFIGPTVAPVKNVKPAHSIFDKDLFDEYFKNKGVVSSMARKSNLSSPLMDITEDMPDYLFRATKEITRAAPNKQLTKDFVSSAIGKVKNEDLLKGLNPKESIMELMGKNISEPVMDAAYTNKLGLIASGKPSITNIIKQKANVALPDEFFTRVKVTRGK